MSSSRRAFTLMELLIVCAIIGILVGMLLPAVQSVRESANTIRCHHNFRQIGIALMTYQDACTRLPDTTHFFQTLFPYLEENNQVGALDEELAPLATLNCPSRRPKPMIKTDYGVFSSQYRANGGSPGSVLDQIFWPATVTGGMWHAVMHVRNGQRPAIWGTGYLGGIHQWHYNCMATIPDGASNTLLMAHKGLDPEYYTQPCQDPEGFAEYNGPTVASIAEMRDRGYLRAPPYVHGSGLGFHGVDLDILRYPWAFLRDKTGGYYCEELVSPFWEHYQYIPDGKVPCYSFMTSPHKSGMPTLWADGSVRAMAYSKGTNLGYNLVDGKYVPRAASLQNHFLGNLWMINDGELTLRD